MKLVAYVKPYSNSSFSIPLYKDGNLKGHYIHTLKGLTINSFVFVNFTEDSIVNIDSNLEFNINEYCAIVYISSHGNAIIARADEIFEKALNQDKAIINNNSLLEEFNEIKKKLNDN